MYSVIKSKMVLFHCKRYVPNIKYLCIEKINVYEIFLRERHSTNKY